MLDIKFRRNKVKREHGIIQNALPWLEKLARLPEVTDIIPGVIDVRHSSERGIVYKYKTQTGCKLLLKSNGSIQEAFVVTKNPSCVQEWIAKEFPPGQQELVPEEVVKNVRQVPLRKKPAHFSSKIERATEAKPYVASGRHRPRKGSFQKKSLSIMGEDFPNVASHLDSTTLKALGQLKQSLEKAKIKTAQLGGQNPTHSQRQSRIRKQAKHHKKGLQSANNHSPD